MKNDYIEIGEKKYRVEFNWNAITDFLESEGLELGDVDNLKTLKPRQVTGLIFAGVVEGCRLEGQEFSVTKLDFGAMTSPEDVGELMVIYTRQTMGKKKEVKEVKDLKDSKEKKNWRSRLRLRDSSR